MSSVLVFRCGARPGYTAPGKGIDTTAKGEDDVRLTVEYATTDLRIRADDGRERPPMRLGWRIGVWPTHG